MPNNEPGLKLTPIQWTICAVAALGFCFDIYELLMLPLIVRMEDLGMAGRWADRANVGSWYGRMRARPSFAEAIPQGARISPRKPGLPGGGEDRGPAEAERGR